MPGSRRVAIVGAGWSGLAAALECADAGAQVTLFEMAPIAGGRARDVGATGEGLDNGQHICIGAYRETRRLISRLGVAETNAFLRLPLRLVDAEGIGLRLPAGPPTPAFVRGVWGHGRWPWQSKLALLRAALGWKRSGFRCDASMTVADLCQALPASIRSDLVEPLCIAAMNTPAASASGAVFLRVLNDALASGPGASDLLLPRLGLSSLLPTPALRSLANAGVSIRLAHRVGRIEADGSSWRVDGEACDAVIVAASAVESARLVTTHDPAWSACAVALRYEPIVTLYANSAGARLPEPMLSLHADATRPAQFVFDRGQLGGAPGLLAFVISGAADWVERGVAATEQAVLTQAAEALEMFLRQPLRSVRTIVEKRATFRCTPRLARPAMSIAPGIFAAGDFIDGPYPATLEGAVRSGVAAARAALD
ncbi:MAG: hydroxysqualene dehydroxylase HpnE [Caldimonas sp.]